MKTKNQRAEQRKLKRLKCVQDIAEAFLKARGTYPADRELFEEMAPKKESDCFYSTMYLCNKCANDYGYTFEYYYLGGHDEEWMFYFVDDSGASFMVSEEQGKLELVCIGEAMT